MLCGKISYGDKMEKTLAYKLNKDINKEQVIKGEKYRITLLGDKMLRIEYSPNGIFEMSLQQWHKS